MSPISVSISTYVLAIVFAMVIALVIKGLAVFIEKLGLDRDDEALDVMVPTANSLKEEEAIAVVIAVARVRQK